MTKPNPDMNSEFRDYPTITADQLQKAITQDVHIKALRALSQVGADAAAKLRAQHQEAVASCLLASGVNLIPSEHLSDNQFVVSRGVYEAAKRIIKDDEWLEKNKFDSIWGVS